MRSDCGEHAQLLARAAGSSGRCVLSSRTASRRNSNEYGGVDGIEHSSSPAGPDGPAIKCPRNRGNRTVYRPGEVCQFDLWEPRAEVPVGHGQTRRGWVVVACLGYSRAGAGALIFSKQTPDLLAGIARCLWSLGALPETLVWDRQAGIHGHGGRPSEEFAAFCGQLRVDWQFCAPADPQAKGVVERLQDFIERSFEPGRAFANELDFQLQLDTWFAERANVRHHKTLRCRPIDRLLEEREVMAPLPAAGAGHRPALGAPGPARPAPALRHLRLLAGPWRWSAGASRSASRRREVLAVALDTGELACRHQRSFAKHRTITDLAHARALRAGRAEPSRRSRSGRWRATTR